MNKFLKRICSIILAIGIVVTAMPSSVFALELSFDKLSFNEFSEQVTTLIEGDSNVFSEAAIGEDEESDKTNRLIVKADKREIDTLGATAYVRGYNDLHILQYSDEKSADSALAYYKKQSYVDYVHEDDFCESVEVAEGSAVTNPMQDVSDLFGYTALNTYLSDNNITFTNEIVVGVVDTGIANDHELLKGRVKPTGFNSVDSSSNCYDDRGHGTHVAGIIAANTLSNVTIKPYKVLNSKGLGTDLQVYLGIMQAVNDDVDIINLSFSRRGESDIMHEAVTAAYNAGVIVVSSAGNKGISLDEVYYSPACFDEVICVASCSDTTYVSDFSNYGTYCDVAAPGENIVSSHLDNTYKSMSGTSMSAPFITAAVAYILSQSPNFTFDDVMARILENVKPCKGRTVGKYLNAEYVTRQKEPSISPEFSYVKTLFSTPFELELSCEDESAEIYYTTSYMIDGQYELYTAPIPVNYDIDVTAYTISEGSKQSYSTTMSYTKTVSASSGFSANADGVLIGYSGDDPNPVVPNRIDGVYVTSVSKDAFSGNEDIQSVSFLSYVNVIEDDAFVGCTNLEYVRAKEVVSIGDRAFQGCTNLLSVNSPKLEIIGEYAFADCVNLTTMALTTVTDVNAGCFLGCSSLVNIGPNSIETIGEKAFKGSSVSNVTLNVCREIASDAFENCTNISVFVAPYITSFDGSVFTNCTKLSHIELDSITSMGDQTFEGHGTLGLFHADKLEHIPDRMFAGCDNLYDVSVGDLKTIGEYAFYKTHITDAIFDNATYVGDYAFSDIYELTNVSLNSASEINLCVLEDSPNIETLSYGSATKFVYDEAMGFAPLDDIFPKIKSFYATNLEIVPDFTFKNCTYEVDFNMPNLKEVGDYAFYGTSFSELNGENIVKIGKHAFNKCSGITEAICPQAEFIGAYAFANCDNLTVVDFAKIDHFDTNIIQNNEDNIQTLVINQAKTITSNGKDTLLSELFPNIVNVGVDSVITIPDNFLKDAVHLESVSVNSATSIGDNAFSGCSNITEFKADSLETFEFNIIEGCEALVTLSLNGVTHINDDPGEGNGFDIYPKLKNLYLDSLTQIPAYCTQANETLELISINSVTEIPAGAFRGNTNLKTVYADSVTVVGQDAFQGSGITTVSLASLEHIPNYMFQNTKVKNVTLTGVKTIGAYAFANTPLENIDLSLLESVGDYAFKNTKLRMFSANNLKSMGKGVLLGVTTLVYINLNSIETLTNVQLFGMDATNETLGIYMKLYSFTANNIKHLHDKFFYETTIRRVVCGSLESVGASAFEKSDLNYLEAPNLRSIGDRAFYDIDIRSLDFSLVEFIGERAFEQSTVSVEGDFGSLEELGSYAFHNASKVKRASYDFSSLKIIHEHAFCDMFDTSGDVSVMLPNAVEIYDLPISGTVMIGSVTEKINLSDTEGCTLTIYAPKKNTVVKNYCETPGLNYIEFNSQTGIVSDAASTVAFPDIVEFEARGFNLKYRAYGATKADLSDSVLLMNSRFIFYRNECDWYPFLYIEAISTENGNEVVMRSRVCKNVDRAIGFEMNDVTTYPWRNILWLDNIQGITSGDVSNMMKASDGYTYTITPSYMYEHKKLYGSGSSVNAYFGDELVATYTLGVEGDVNGDSYIDVLDAMAVSKYINGYGDDELIWASDFDRNSSVDVSDYQQIVNKTVA